MPKPVQFKPGWLRRDVEVAVKREQHWSRGMTLDRCPCDQCAAIRACIQKAEPQ